MLLDTSGLASYLDETDLRHAEALELFRSAHVRITHNYVLAELVPLCQARGVGRALSLAFASELLNTSLVVAAWVDEPLHREAIEFLRARPDKSYSLCDAVSFILMRRHGISQALTADRDFEREGFVRLLRP